MQVQRWEKIFSLATQTPHTNNISVGLVRVQFVQTNMVSFVPSYDKFSESPGGGTVESKDKCASAWFALVEGVAGEKTLGK